MTVRCKEHARIGPSPLVALLVLWLGAVTGAAGDSLAALEDSASSALARIETAQTRHPDDPALLWALAMALARAGQIEAASTRLESFIARWPARRPNAHFELGKLLFRAGRDGRAQRSFALALQSQPTSGPTHFYHALSLRRLGRRDEAAGELSLARRYEPALEPEVLLVRALDLFEVGQDEEAVQLLHRVLEIDPSGEAARRVRLLLLERETRSTRRWYRVDALAGLEYDSNVDLDSGTGDLASASEEDDLRGVWGAGLTLRPVHTQRWRLSLGYRYDQVHHRASGQYDYISNLGYGSASYLPTRRLALRLDGVAFNTRTGGSSYVTVTSLHPNLLFSFGPRIGTTRLFADFAWQMYRETPTIAFFERDAVVFGTGFEHYVSLLLDDTWGSLAGRFERSQTDSPVIGRFGGDYDRDLWEARIRLHVPLLWGVLGEGWMAFAHQRYGYDNYLAFMTDLIFKRRRDNLLEGRIALSRSVSRFTRLELAWRGTRRNSNISTFDYRRHTVGLYLRFSSE